MTRRTLVAGIGNIFLGDDGFGVEVVRRLAGERVPDGVEVRDFGIRGMDLVYALLDEYDTVIFVDAAMRGEQPGTLSLLEVQMSDEADVTLDTHGMDPARVLTFARELGARPRPTYVITCEPALVVDADDDPEVVVELSAPVGAAVDSAVQMVQSLLSDVAAVQAETV